MTTLTLNKLYKKYPNSDFYSVENFDLDIKDKEFIVLQDRPVAGNQQPCG